MSALEIFSGRSEVDRIRSGVEVVLTREQGIQAEAAMRVKGVYDLLNYTANRHLDACEQIAERSGGSVEAQLALSGLVGDALKISRSIIVGYGTR